jgi:purine catabolism regulator
LSFSSFQRGQPTVIAGAQRLDRPVRWVHVSESADLTGLLEGGELVLTTGLPLTGTADRVAGYLQTLATVGIAALTVEFGTHITAVPAEIAARAEALGLVLVVLAEKIRFVEVTEQVHRLIVAEQYEELEFARATHEAFTDLNMTGASAGDIVTRAAQTLQASLVLEDLNRRVLAFSAVDIPTSDLLADWEDRSRRHDGPFPNEPWRTVSVGLGPDRWGRLVLPTAGSSPARTQLVLERAAQALQLHRMADQARDALEAQALGGLLEDLLNGRIEAESDAVARAIALGLSPGARYAPLALRATGRPGADPLHQGESDRRLLAAAREAARAAGLTALASVRRAGGVIMLVSCPTGAGVDNALAALCVRLSDRAVRPGDRWVAGTSDAARDLLSAAAGLTEAELTAEVALSMPPGKRLFRAADIRLRGLVALLRHDHRMQTFAEAELGPLLAHDARRGDTLMTVLRAFLDAGGSKSQTALATNLSRPTLYGRLRSIERILGVPLDTADSRTSLHLALMIVDAR